MSASGIVRFGRRLPMRWIVMTVAITLVPAIGIVVATAASGHPEQWPYALIVLVIPVIAIPAILLLNTWAEYDPVAGTIALNGQPSIPVSALTYATFTSFRGVFTLVLGTGPTRKATFAVSAGSPFGSPRVERDAVRQLLPSTGLPRDPDRPLPFFFGRADAGSITLDAAQVFAADYVK